MSVRVDSGLYKRFRRAARDLYGSVCNPVEAFMLTVVEAHKGLPEGAGSTPGLTVGKRPEVKVEIGSFHVERLLRPRRKVDPIPHREAVAARLEEVGAWSRKVLGALPGGTGLSPMYALIRELGVPQDLRREVADNVVDKLSKGGEK